MLLKPTEEDEDMMSTRQSLKTVLGSPAPSSARKLVAEHCPVKPRTGVNSQRPAELPTNNQVPIRAWWIRFN